ncbi:HAUS6 [Mytilus coruscus]|uniref:HAUS6 n=1 Tax=Mytilus coruscus TaxID=42192 RepID=A0A6J8F0T4_MYTCO|nr:HAUS6 [Mytilus coruscus]
MGDPLDMKQIFFTNLQVLGFDAAAEGQDNKIPFNKNMFDLPNKRGSEVVLHFLFEKLNPVMCREEFRHCWPIIDKQQEAQFRRTCNNWLNNISKNEPDSHLPRITGSLFLSPGGEKFIQLLLHFSRYVLQQDIERMGGKDKDHLLIANPRIDTNCPMVRKRRSTNAYEYDFDPQSIKRAQRVQEVRDLWKQFDDFCTREASEREVIESIVDKTMNKCKINASDVNIKVPDLLLTECEDEIRKRHVDSNFHHGKLNLVSIIQLWNLCLHLYIEKIHQAGVPKFEEEVKAITDKVHTSTAYLFNTQSLKEQIASILPELKESIDYLRNKIDKEVTISSTPRSLRTTSVGMGLMEPSPPVSFTPRKTTEITPEGTAIKLSPDDVTTPEAVSRIADNVTGTVRKGPNNLFQGTPVYAGSVKQDARKTGRVNSKLPKKTKTESSNSRTVDVRGQLHSTPTRAARPTVNNHDWDGIIQQPETLISQLKNSPPHSEQSFHSDRNTNKSNITQTSGTITPKLSPRSDTGPVTPRNKSYNSPFISPRQGQRSAEVTPRKGHRSPSDMIVDEVMGFGVMSPGMSGAEAFRTKAEIPRSPISVEVKMMFREAMSNESSPQSDRSRSSRSQKSAEHSFNMSDHGLYMQKDNPTFGYQNFSKTLNTSKNTTSSSNQMAVEPPQNDEMLSSDAMNNSPYNEGKISNGQELELLSSLQLQKDKYLEENRPKSPVGETLDSIETDPEDNSTTSKFKRKVSPKDEEDDFYLEQPEGLLSSEAEEDTQYETLSKKFEEQKAFITKEVIPRSPLKDEIRRMFKEAMSDVEDSPLHKSSNRPHSDSFSRSNHSKERAAGIDDSFYALQAGNSFDLQGAGDGIGLEDIEMPDMPLEDSFGESYGAGIPNNTSNYSNKAINRDSVGLDLISFTTPKSDVNLFQTYDARKLKEAKHDLDEIFSQSLPLRVENIRQAETKQQLTENKTQLKQLEKSIGELEGKLLEISSNEFLNPDSKDDSDLIDNLDDSFVPVKGGVLVEGGTPLKSRSLQNVNKVPTNNSNDIRTRMQQLKEVAKKISSDFNV